MSPDHIDFYRNYPVFFVKFWFNIFYRKNVSISPVAGLSVKLWALGLQFWRFWHDKRFDRRIFPSYQTMRLTIRFEVKLILYWWIKNLDHSSKEILLVLENFKHIQHPLNFIDWLWHYPLVVLEWLIQDLSRWRKSYYSYFPLWLNDDDF
jgi:hypothetical protein